MDLEYPTPEYSSSDWINQDFSINVEPKTVSKIQQTEQLKLESLKTEQEIAELNKKRLGYEKMFIALVLMVVVCVIIHFIFVFVSIRIQFGDLIDYIDNEVVAKGKAVSQSEQSQYYNYTDGYSIAFYYKFPRIPTNPFLNTAFPASIVFSYYTKRNYDIFTKDPTLVQQMYVYSVIGDINQCGTQDPSEQQIQQTCAEEPSAHQIICATYGTANGLADECKQVCRKNTSLDTFTMVGQIVAMGGMGAFVGGMTGKGLYQGQTGIMMGEAGPGAAASGMIGAGIMFTVGVTMAVVTTQMSKTEDEDYQKSLSAGYCEEPKT